MFTLGFFKDVTTEMRKMSWLSKKEVWGQLIAIHLIAGAIIAYFFGIDFVVNGIKNIF